MKNLILGAAIFFLVSCKDEKEPPAFCWKCITTKHSYPPPTQPQVVTNTIEGSEEKCNMTEAQIAEYERKAYFEYSYHSEYNGHWYRDMVCTKK